MTSLLTCTRRQSGWRSFKKKIVKALRANMSLEEIDRAVNSGDGKKSKVFITLFFTIQYVNSGERFIKTEIIEVRPIQK